MEQGSAKTDISINSSQTVGWDTACELAFYFSFCTIGAIPEYRSSLAIIIFSVLVLIRQIIRRESFGLSKSYLIFLLLFLPSVVNYFVEPVHEEGLFDLVQKLPFLILPLVMSWFNPSRKVLELGLLFFAFSTVVLCLWTYRHGNFTAFYDPEIYDDFSINPPILGMYAVISMVIFYRSRIIDTVLKMIFGGFLVVFNFLVLNKLVVLLSLTVLGYIIYAQAKEGAIRRLLQYFVLIGFFLVTLALISFSKNERDNVVSTVETYIEQSMSTRTEVWACAGEISRFRFFGLGTGEAQQELNRCYEEHFPESVVAREHLNPHNQYLASYLYYGVFGVLCLGVFIVGLLWRSWQLDSFLLFSFLVVFLSFNVLESTFQVYRSMVFVCYMGIVLVGRGDSL